MRKLKCLFGFHKFTDRIYIGNLVCVEGGLGKSKKAIVTCSQCQYCPKKHETQHWGEIETIATVPIYAGKLPE